MTEQYLHHWLHHARARELRADADAHRLATAVYRQRRGTRCRTGCKSWPARLWHRLRRLRCPDCPHRHRTPTATHRTAARS